MRLPNNPHEIYAVLHNVLPISLIWETRNNDSTSKYYAILVRE